MNSLPEASDLEGYRLCRCAFLVERPFIVYNLSELTPVAEITITHRMTLPCNGPIQQELYVDGKRDRHANLESFKPKMVIIKK